MVATDGLSVQLASIKIGFRVLGSLHIFCGGRSSPESIALSIAAQNAASIFSSSARMRISSIANSSCMVVFPISLRRRQSTHLSREDVHQVEASSADDEDDCHVRQRHEHQSRPERR